MINISQDAASGAILTVVGGLSAVVSSGYSLGTAQSMGPGYFPLVVSSLMVLAGLSLLARSRLATGEEVAPPRWRSMVAVLAGILAFGLTVEPLGSFIAVLLTLVCSASGSAHFRFRLLPILGAIGFSALCSLTFSVLLGLPLPVIGSWLQPLLPF